MERGQVVEFRHQGLRRLAILDRPEGKKCWVAIDPQGRNHTLYPRDVTYTVGQLRLDVDELSSFCTHSQALCDGADLEVAWELLCGEVVTPTVLADLVFGEATPLHQYAAHLLLSEDKLYFKQKGDAYEARPAAQVAELKHQLARQTQRQQEQAGFQERLRQALAHQPVTWEGSDRPRLEALEQFATVGEQAPRAQAAAEVLTQAGRPATPEAAHLLLIDLGVWSLHENLALRRSQVPVTFPPRVLDVSLPCPQSPPPDPDAQHRLDLTGLKVYTIDDASTREIDDGLSLEDLGNGQQRLWIHIADPGRWLTPGDVLDQEARRRSTSLYLPTGTIPMFPEVLATGPMSLAQGQDCPALSFGVVLDETGAIASYDLYASRVR
ncbi:MAG: RNB domain-containing ribonuclease, partial [Gloeomargaritaceae cyanobacterium C42_A2020_066]|nr:RNB domain-containing ribonuclease [Gloeomargaritaceae cyanobacterium C42_A2020_066]